MAHHHLAKPSESFKSIVATTSVTIAAARNE